MEECQVPGRAAVSSAQIPDARRLRTRLQWQQLSRQPQQADLRIALLASFTIDPLVPFLGVALANAGVQADIWVAPFNQVEVQCLDQHSATARFEPQLVVVYPRLEELWTGMQLPLYVPADDYERDLLNLADACISASHRWQSELLFVLPAVPEARPAGVGDDGNPTGMLATASRARETVRKRLAGQAAVAVVDAESVLRTVGSRSAYRPDLLAAARIPFSDEYFELLAQRISRLVAARRAGPPLIVVDSGSLAAEIMPPVVGDMGVRSPLGALEEYLTEVSRLGASIALCNATQQVQAQFAARVPVAVSRDPDLASADQIRELAVEHDTELEQIVFLSSRASATEDVGQDLPQVRTVLLPPRPEFWVQALNDSGIVDQIPSACEDRLTSASPSPAAARVLTLDGFLQRLRLDVECVPLALIDAEAAADLSRRAADFHLNGEVWSADRWCERAKGDVGGCWGVTVRDRFGDHGLSGVIAAQRAATALLVDMWVLSCQVLGKNVECHVLGFLAGQARRWQCTTIEFDYRATGRNDVLRQFLARLWPEAVSPQADPVSVVQVPILAAERQYSAAGLSQAANASPHAGGDSLRRRPAAEPATSRLVSASQIVLAMRAQGSERLLASTPGPSREPSTETEEILARVFATVLRQPSVGVDCNFFTLGDSMAAVELIAKANKAGLRLTLRQVFQHQTVAALAAVATKAVPRSGADGISGPVPVLPLPAWFFGRNLRSPGHFNQSQRYEVPEHIDVSALERAVSALIGHHQALRMRYFPTETGWRQADPGPPERPPFTHVNLRETPPHAWSDELASYEAKLQLSMSPEEGRLAQFALFSFGPQRPPHLLVMLHHLAVDGISWRIILDDLQEAYHQACHGGTIRLSPVSMPVLAWAKQLSQFANSPQARAELSAWLTQARSTVQPVPLDNPDAAGPGAFTHFEETVFTTADTRRLRERAVQADRVSVDILLLAGAMRTVARWTGRRRILVDVVNHGREPFIDGADLSRTVGWLVVNVPVLFEVNPEQSSGDLVPDVSRQMRAWSSDHGMGESLLRFLSDDESIRQRLAALPGADLLFSYAGHFDDPSSVEHPLLGRAIEPYSADMDPDGGTPYALQFDSMIVGDQIRLTVCYRQTQYQASTAEGLLKSWAADLRDLIRVAGSS
jgi:FkbH-like protein/non-ribosomal peptide synthase protein (TIGR01720 family)